MEFEASGEGHATPEEAARGDIPPQFATVVGHSVQGDRAKVWLLTNDQRPFEEYEGWCVRVDGKWYSEGGMGGFGMDTPPDVEARARELRDRHRS